MIFTLFYLFVAIVIYILAIPIIFALSFKQKYKSSILARFFLYKNRPFKRDGIWFHAASLGEVKSLKPIVNRLDGVKNISTITQTGYKEASSLVDIDSVRYLPYEIFLPFWIGRERVLVVCEAELWYMLFFTAKKRGARTYLINARVSDRSYRRYLRFKWLYKRVFQNIDLIFSQSEKDRDRLLELGAKDVVVNGNIKAFLEIEVKREFIKPDSEVITLASTHSGEEELILQNINPIKGRQKILVVPRHPERFSEVDRYLNRYAKDRSLTYHLFSKRESFDSDIVLIDTMGVLISIYAISDIVLLGGSFVEGVGGHNPLEPAYFGCKIISGKEIFNQKELFKIVDGIEMVDSSKISDTISRVKKSSIKSSIDITPIIKELSR